MKAGIVSYGAYVPMYRITPETIGHQWGKDGESIGRALGVKMKSVPGPDEDTATMAVEAARSALKRADIDPKDLGAIYVGSESHPYAVKPTGTIVGEAIEATPDLMCADLEFACKAGTAGMQMSMALVLSEMVKYSIAIGADTAQAAPGNMLEYTAAAGAAAFIIGTQGKIADIEHTLSFTTDTPDFWRRAEMKYPSHGGRFTGKPAYFKHVVSCGKKLLAETGTAPKDYDFAVFHQPNSKFPIRAGKMLGFSMEQMEEGLMVPEIGNTYSGSTMVGLASILDAAQPGQRIFAVSYGSGAGSDGFVLTVTDEIKDFNRGKEFKVREIINRKSTITYGIYSKFYKKLKMEGE